ncbi:MAG: DUF2975 domain-containing protein [Bacillota bacterium]
MERKQGTGLTAFRNLVQVVWFGLILVLTYLCFVVPVALTNPRFIRPGLGVGFWGPGLIIGLAWDSLTPEHWRSYLLPVGLFGIAGTAAVLYAVHQIRCMLRETGTSPFTAANADRIRKAGLAVLCSAAAKAFRDVSFGNFVTSNVQLPGAVIRYATDLGLSTAFLGIMILAVAEVMRHGVALQEDQDLTV